MTADTQPDNPIHSQLFSLFHTGKGKDCLIGNMVETNLIICETKKKGELTVSFKDGPFIPISEKVLGTNKFINFFNRGGGDVLRKTCDGIFIVPRQDRIILCLVELKVNINNHFQKAVKQIDGAYLKMAMLLSLILDTKDIEIVIFLAGGLERVDDDPDLNYLEKVEEYRGKTDNLETKLKDFSRKKEIVINVPFLLGETIHHNYRKRNISVFHLKDGETFDMKRITIKK